MSFLEVKNISKQLQNNAVVTNVSFQVSAGTKFAIAGETGSGKSSVMKMIAGLVQPDAGQVYFEDKRVIGPDEQLLPGHPSIAYLSQHFELRNNYRVEELLDYANKWTDDEAQNIYEICRIDHLLKRRTDQLSGGEKQRIATARLLVGSPKLLLLDEPYSNLDMAHRLILKQVIADIGNKLNITCLLISHEPADVLPWADEILVMKGGQPVQHADPQTIYREPLNEYVAGLFGDYNLLKGKVVQALSGGTRETPLIVRPEDLTISHNGGALAGIVTNVEYVGSWYQVQVLTDGVTMTVRALARLYTPGDHVYISMA